MFPLGTDGIVPSKANPELRLRTMNEGRPQHPHEIHTPKGVLSMAVASLLYGLATIAVTFVLILAALGKSGAPVTLRLYVAAFSVGIFGCALGVFSILYAFPRAATAMHGFGVSFSIGGWLFIFALPIETGLADFLAFSSFWKYPPLLISFLGILGAIRVILLRRKTRSGWESRGRTGPDVSKLG